MKVHISENEINSDLKKILSGLKKPVKTFHSEFTFDKNGSQIYDKMCNLPEYYPAHKEMAIMQQYIDEIVSLAGASCLLIEYGSGSSQKTCVLLDHLPALAGYVPIDISKEYLLHSATKIAENYPNIEVLPICTNYHHFFEPPLPTKLVKRRFIFFSGIAIGNEHQPELITLLKKIKQICGANGALLVSVDLKKNPQILNLAYNDSAGLNTMLGLNYLWRINREFDADFQINQFEYKAIYNEQLGRMEMKLFSLQEQAVHIRDHCFELRSGEPIMLGCSYKYTLTEFANLVAQAGWEVHRVWTDAQKLFSIQYLTVASSIQT
jgi:dimethylhistidine N-methyltransferase